MGLVIGMDEAGYGPNLGPLVVTVTAWEVPGSPRDAKGQRGAWEAATRPPFASGARLFSTGNSPSFDLLSAGS